MNKQILALVILGGTLLSVGYLLGQEKVDTRSDIQKIADAINSDPTSTWQAEKTPSEADVAYRSRMFNLIIDEVPAEFDEQPELSVADLPENFDSRTNWKDCQSIKEIRDQSGCGSCWAFGAAGAMSDRVCIASQQKDQRRVSSEDILECCKICGMGCNGGFLYATWLNWKAAGYVTGSFYQNNDWCKAYKFPPCNHHSDGPYEDCSKHRYATPKCEKDCSNKDYPKKYKDDKIYAAKIYNIKRGETEIQQEIFTHGPVEAAFSVYQDFLAYKSGVYEHKQGSFLGGHAIKIIGWGVENGVKFWTIVNSWNESWGEKGTFRILRGANHCGIEGNVVAGLPKL
jgi:cathepsin B